MRYSDSLKLAFQNLWRTRFRSFLTVFGVVIGISAIVLFVSLGVGLQKITADQITNNNSLTTLTVTQTPATASMEAGPSITDDTIEKVSPLQGVKLVSPSVTLPANVTSGGTSAGAIVNGVKLDGFQAEVPVLLFGNAPKDESEAVVSSMLAGSFVTNKEDIIGKEIEIGILSDEPTYKSDNLKFKISGVDNNESANMVYASLDKIYTAGKFDKYSSLKVVAKASKDINGIQTQIKNLGYQTTTIKDLIDQIDKIFLLVEIILGIVAGIGLLVSSLGIINTMIISLLERTREIGIMKAIGASNNDIRRLFYLESCLIGFFGGVLGVSLAFFEGKLLNFGINAFIKASGQHLDLFITPPVFTGVMLIFAIFLSLFAGIYPAWRAKKLSPMSALRQ